MLNPVTVGSLDCQVSAVAESSRTSACMLATGLTSSSMMTGSVGFSFPRLSALATRYSWTPRGGWSVTVTGAVAV